MDWMMYWDFWWLVLGAAAFILAFINLIQALRKKHSGWQGLLFASLSCGGLAMLAAYLGVYDEVQEGDWPALMDVVPTVTGLCAGAVCWGILLNFFALYIHLKAEITGKEAGIDGKS